MGEGKWTCFLFSILLMGQGSIGFIIDELLVCSVCSLLGDVFVLWWVVFVMFVGCCVFIL